LAEKSAIDVDVSHATLGKVLGHTALAEKHLLHIMAAFRCAIQQKPHCM